MWYCRVVLQRDAGDAVEDVGLEAVVFVQGLVHRPAFVHDAAARIAEQPAGLAIPGELKRASHDPGISGRFVRTTPANGHWNGAKISEE